MQVPYYAQWESRELVADFISGAKKSEDDPLWRESGAPDAAAYAFWARRVCGMACLQMLLAYRTGKKHPIHDLTRACIGYGGYEVMPDGGVKGLTYKPFVDFVRQDFAVQTEVHAEAPVETVAGMVEGENFFIASVHPGIRTPEVDPPSQGGHLILMFRNPTDPARLMFHNPSGFTPASQENVDMDVATFARFYAGRGVLIPA